ncbi:MAG: dihydrolipoamide acetyltransferase family protein [Candidatus Delongbacteria bacterium]
MAYVFLFPDLGEGLTEGKLLQWYVQEGQLLQEGDLLAKVETDKVVADIPVPRAGRVLRLHGRPEEILLVGHPLVELETGDGTASAAASAPAPAVAAATEPVGGESGPGVVGNIEVATGPDVMPASGEGLAPVATTSDATGGGRVTASPVARRLAKDLGVDLSRLAGSGPQGRVMKADIQRAGQTAASPASASSVPAQVAAPAAGPRGGERTEPLSQLRKTVAARMVQSKFSAPHATTFEEVEVSRLVELRASQRERYEAQGLRLSYMPFICKAVATALRRHPKLNCRLDMERSQVTFHDFVHLGLAVDTPEGLLVPVIRDADTLSIRELALRIADLAERARTRQIRLDELRGGTFTITNYGAIAGIFGAPIINVPESAILGVGRLLDQPVVRQGAVVPGKVLPLSLAVDHRIIDGGDAARFLRELMDLLANPLAMLMD